MKMQDLDLIIFDECHHTNQDHLYNLIMRDFFFHEFVPGVTKRPRILGLTASPIKQKIDSQYALKSDIEFML
jgi:endoribonuclease Dicer